MKSRLAWATERDSVLKTGSRYLFQTTFQSSGLQGQGWERMIKHRGVVHTPRFPASPPTLSHTYTHCLTMHHTTEVLICVHTHVRSHVLWPHCNHFYLGFSPAQPARTPCSLPVSLFTGQQLKRTAAGAGPAGLNLLSTLGPAYRRTREDHEAQDKLRLQEAEARQWRRS